MQRVLVVVIAGHETVQDVVAVGGNDQLIDRQPHVARQVAGEDVTEIAGRDREGDRTRRAAQLQCGMEVVDDLGHDPRPVDRVDCHQAGALEEPLVGEAGLDHLLAVIEVAFDGDVVNVVAEDGGHLPALHFRHALVRVQDEDVDVLAAAAAFDGRRAGITRGGAHDHHALATLGQHVVEQTAEQLQGEILEGQGRTVEQLEHPLVAVQLAQRGNGAMGENAIGLFQDFLEVGIRNAAGNEWSHDPERQFVIRQAGPGSDFLYSEARQVLRHVEAAVAGQTGQQHIFEIQGRCLAAGADVAHFSQPSIWAWTPEAAGPPGARSAPVNSAVRPGCVRPCPRRHRAARAQRWRRQCAVPRPDGSRGSPEPGRPGLRLPSA